MKTLMVNSNSVENAMDAVPISNLEYGDSCCQLSTDDMILDHVVMDNDRAFLIHITNLHDNKTIKIFIQNEYNGDARGITVTVF